ncbi:MAG: SGNH/GDSL hydrolase family protein [Rectinemataceae bacterium]
MIAFSFFDLVVFGALFLFFVSVIFLSRAGYDLAPNNPKAFRALRDATRDGSRGSAEACESPRERRLAVCAGDSITRGAVSVNYVSMLEARLPDWEFVNAGVNGELAYNLAQRMEDIVALDPDAVTILIGTNDVNATFGFQAALGYIATKRLPEMPSPDFFRENLVGIVRTLKRETRARIALFSIPPIGEEPEHYAYLRTEDYAKITKSVARDEDVEYLPLRERLCTYIEGLPTTADRPLGFRKIPSAVLRAGRTRQFLGKSLDEISASNRFHILIDGIHLNTHGASMAADLAESFLRSRPAPD